MQDDSSPEEESRSIYDDMKEHYRRLGIETPEGWLFTILDEYIAGTGLEKSVKH